MVLGAITAVVWLIVLNSGNPGAAQAVDPAYEQASVRWAIVLTSQRIEDFRRQFHRAPSGLAELGLPGPALISYERVADDRYRLSAPTTTGPVVFDSMRSRESFAGHSLELLTASTGVAPR